MNGAEALMRLRLRIKMPEMPTAAAAPTFSTATIAALMAAFWPVADPFLVALGGYITAHTSIAFPDGYSMTVRAALEAAVTALAIRWHMGE